MLLQKEKNMLPFKHIFALFNVKSGLDWNALPESYRNFQFFSLDIIKNNNIETSASGAASDLSMEDEIYEENNHVNFNLLKKQQYFKKSKTSIYREILKQIGSLTFLIQDNDVFNKFEEDLWDIFEDLKRSASSESGLVKKDTVKYKIVSKKGNI